MTSPVRCEVKSATGVACTQEAVLFTRDKARCVQHAGVDYARWLATRERKGPVCTFCGASDPKADRCLPCGHRWG